MARHWFNLEKNVSKIRIKRLPTILQAQDIITLENGKERFFTQWRVFREIKIALKDYILAI